MAELDLTVKINGDAQGMAQAVKSADSSFGTFANEITRVTDKLDGVTRQLKKNGDAAKEAGSGYSSMLSIASKLGNAFNGIKIATGWVHDLMDAYIGLGDAIDKASIRTGLSADSLSRLKFAAEQSGGSFEALTAGLRGMQNVIGQAQMGMAEGTKWLSMLGLNTQSFFNMKPEQQFMEIAQAISKLSDSSTQAKVTMGVFSEAGYKILPMLKAGKDGIKALTDEAKDLNIGFSGEASANAAALGDAFNRMGSSLNGAYIGLANSFAPALTKCCDVITAATKALVGFVEANKSLVIATATLAAIPITYTAIGTAITAIIPLALKAAAAIKAIGVAMMANPYMLAIAAIVAVASAGYSAISGIWAEAEKGVDKTVHETRQYTKAVEESRAATQGLLDELAEISSTMDDDPFNSANIEKAVSVVEKLTEKYGDLGISIDENTGKLKGMEEAQALISKKETQKQWDALTKDINTKRDEQANFEYLADLESNKWLGDTVKIEDYKAKAKQAKRDKENLMRERDTLEKDGLEMEGRTKAASELEKQKRNFVYNNEQKKTRELEQSGASDSELLSQYGALRKAAKDVGNVTLVKELESKEAALRDKPRLKKQAEEQAKLEADAKAKAEQEQADQAFINNNQVDGLLNTAKNNVLDLEGKVAGGDDSKITADALAAAKKELAQLELDRAKMASNNANLALQKAQWEYDNSMDLPASERRVKLEALNEANANALTSKEALNRAVQAGNLKPVQAAAAEAIKSTLIGGTGFDSTSFMRSANEGTAKKQLDLLKSINQFMESIDKNVQEQAIVGA